MTISEEIVGDENEDTKWSEGEVLLISVQGSAY